MKRPRLSPSSLKKQLYIALLVMLVPMLVVGVVQLVLLRRSTDQLHRLTTELVYEESQLARTKNRLLRTELLVDDARVWSPAARRQFEMLNAEIANELGTIGNFDTVRERSLADSAQATWEEAIGIAETKLSSDATTGPEVKRAEEAFDQRVTKASEILGELSLTALAEVDAETTVRERLEGRELLVFGGIFATAFIVVLVLGKTLHKTIHDPLRELEEAARLLRDDDLSHRVAVTGSSELERVGRAFNTMADSLASSRDALREQNAALAETESRFRGAFHNASIGMALVATDGSFVQINESLCRILGYSEEELLSLKVTDITHPHDIARSHQHVDRALAGEFSKYLIQKRYVHKQGATVWADVSVSVVKDLDGHPLNFVSQIEDVTKRRETDQAMKRLAAVIEATTDIVEISDADGERVFLNRAGRELLGLDQQVAASGAATFISKDGLTAAVRHGYWTGEATFTDQQGDEVPVSQLILTHRDAKGRIQHVSTVARDLSQQKSLEEQLRQSQKMEAIGQLAGGVAHDLNNLLAVIVNYTDFVAETIADKSVSEDVTEIRRASERAMMLVRQLLQFSRRDTVKPVVLDLTDVVSGLEKMLRRLLRESIDLKFELTHDEASLKIDQGQLEQLIVNLVVNAKDAVAPTKGCIVVRTEFAELSFADVEDRPEMQAGRFACLSVSDNGEGMTEQVKARMFDPFFTTKPVGSGTGLGLSTVYGIVKQAGGSIDVQTECGKGTVFRVYFPESHSKPEGENESTSPNDLQRGNNETILVVEDEEEVRKLVVRILTGAGYNVVAEANGDRALARLIDQNERVDLLLTDVIMPGMSGPELADRTGLPSVFMSGYTDQIISAQASLDQSKYFVHKPFVASELLDTVQSALISATRKPLPVPSTAAD